MVTIDQLAKSGVIPSNIAKSLKTNLIKTTDELMSKLKELAVHVDEPLFDTVFKIETGFELSALSDLLDAINPYISQKSETVYHGTQNLDAVLKDGALISSAKRNPDEFDEFFEDVIRSLIRKKYDKLDTISSFDGIKYVESNKDELFEQGSELTKRILTKWESFKKHDFIPKIDNYFLRKYCIWCGNKDDADTYGAVFELQIPEENSLKMGTYRVVPGEIPLKYATKLFIPNASEIEKYSSKIKEENLEHIKLEVK